MPLDEEPTAETTAIPEGEEMPTPSNGRAYDHGVVDLYKSRDIDPAVVLLIQEVRRGQDAMRTDFVEAQRDTTKAIGSLTTEMRELRKQAPGRLSFYLASAVVLLALIATFSLVATARVDVGKVADAVSSVAPTAVP